MFSSIWFVLLAVAVPGGTSASSIPEDLQSSDAPLQHEWAMCEAEFRRLDAALSCAEDEHEESLRSPNRYAWEGYWGCNDTSTNSMDLYLLPRTGATVGLRGCFQNERYTGVIEDLHPDGVTVRYQRRRCPWGIQSVSADPVEYYVGKYQGEEALFTNDVAICLAACMNMDPRRASTFCTESDAGFLLRRWDDPGRPSSVEGPTELPEAFRSLLVSRPLTIEFETSVVCAASDWSIAGRVSVDTVQAKIRVLEGSIQIGHSIAFTIPGTPANSCAIVHVASEPDSKGLVDVRVEPVTFDLLISGFDLRRGLKVFFPGVAAGE